MYFFDPPLGCIGDKFPATSEINFHPLWTSQQPHSCTLLTGFVAILAFSLRAFKFQTLHGQFEMVRAFMEPVNKPSWVAQAQQQQHQYTKTHFNETSLAGICCHSCDRWLFSFD